MNKLIKTIVIITMAGCSCYSPTHWVDGKARSACLRKERAEAICEDHEGIRSEWYGTVICRDGTRARINQ